MSTPPFSRGFTLIETMVAITVLALALIGPFVAVQNALKGSYVARDQLVASSLAQEGLEYIRSVRDDNYLVPRASWLTGLSSLACYGSAPASFCTVDPTQGDVNTAASAVGTCSTLTSCRALYISSNGLYNEQNSGTATRFRRGVKLVPISATEVQVTVSVTWVTSGTTYTSTVTDIIRDWL